MRSKVKLTEESNRPLIALSRYLYQSHHRRVAFHRRYVLGRILSGEMVYRYNGFQSKMRPGTLYLFQPNSLLVDVDCTDGCEVDYYHLDRSRLKWALDGFGVEEDFFAEDHSLLMNADLVNAVEDLNSALRSTTGRCDLQGEMLINLVDLLLDAKDDGRMISPTHIDLDPKVNALKSLIAKTGSGGALAADPELFFSQLGATREEMEGAVRAEIVRELLEKGASLKEAAESLGLGNESALAELFRRSWVVHPDLYQGIALGMAPKSNETDRVTPN